MTNTWVKEEAARQIKATCERDRKRENDLDSLRLELLAERSNHRRDNEYLTTTVHELRAALAEVWASVPPTPEPADPMLRQHAKALNAIPPLLARYPEEPG